MRAFPATPLSSGRFREARLDNGLRAIVLESEDSPIVATALAYGVGSGDEREGETGVSHLLEHMMFKGTRALARGEIDRRTQRAGGRNNAFTGHDATIYLFELAPDKLHVALEIEADRMRNCRLEPGDFASERSVVLEELKRDLDDPWGRLFREVEAALFVRHPYRNPIIGWRDDLERIGRDDLERHYATHYAPDNATLVVTGAARAARVLDAIRRRFGRIARGPARPARRAAEPAPIGEKRVEIRQDVESERLVVAGRGRPLSSGGLAAVDVLKSVLGSGLSSRLHQRLVERDRLATHVDAYHEPRREAGVFLVQAEAQAARDAGAIADALFDEMDALRERLVPDREVEKGKRLAFADFVFSQDTALERAIAIGHWSAVAGVESLRDYPRRLARVTARDVREAAREIFVRDGRVVGISRPEKGLARGRSRPRPRSTARSRAYRTAPAPALTERPLAFERAVLGNGLRVLVLPRRALPEAAVSLYVEGSRFLETDAKAGLSAVVGDLLDAGTRRRSAVEIAETIESVGGEIQTGSEGVRARCLARDFGLALSLVAETAIEPAFRRAEFEKTRERLVSEIRAERDDALTLAQRAFDEIVFRGHPFHRPPRGYERTLAALDRTDCVRHHRRAFSPGNAILAIAGDVDPKAAIRAAAREFARWKTGLPVPSPSPPRPLAGRVERFVRTDREQEQILVGHLGVRRTDPEFDALLVLDLVFGNGPGCSDRLNRRIRDELGLAYTVSGAITPLSGSEPGRLLVHVGTSPEHRARALRVVFEELRRLRAEKPAAGEVEEAKEYLVGSFAFAFETAEQMAVRLLEIERFSLGSDYPSRFAAAVRAVAPDDVVRAARARIHPDRLAIVVAGPERARRSGARGN